MPSPDDVSKKFGLWAHKKSYVDLEIARMNKLRDDLMGAVMELGDKDERGSMHLVLPSPIQVGDKTYEAIKREARTSTTLNEQAALDLAHNKGLQATLIKLEQHINVDALYAAWQRGLISEAELDALYESKTTYAFKPVIS